MIYAILIFGIIVFIMAFIFYSIKSIIERFKPPKVENTPVLIPDETKELNRRERIENYDKQIDGYTQLIKMLDLAYREEHDTKKKAAILSRQLVTLEKLNKTIEKREKIE